MRQLDIRKNKKLAKLKSGKYGKVQGDKLTLGYEIKDEEGNVIKKVGANYVSPEGVKAKDIVGATIIESKYRRAKGKLGGAVDRIPMPERDETPKPKPPKLLQEKTTGFKASKFDSYGNAIVGDAVEGKTKKEIRDKASEVSGRMGVADATKTDLDTHRETTEENENARTVNKIRMDKYNLEMDDYEKAKEDNKFAFGKDRTAEQKQANKAARKRAVITGEGKRKTMRQIYKKIR